MKRLILTAVLSLLLLPHSLRAAEFREVLDGFRLQTNYGNWQELSEYSDQKVLAVVFLGTECPLAKLYGPKLREIQSKYQDQGVTVLGISSNKQDSLTELTAYRHRHELNFPILKDVGNKLADALEATRTPEVFLFDEARQLRYHGRIDDQFGVGYSREKTTSSDMTRAIDELLSGQAVSVAETKAIGCVIGRVKNIEPSGDITFTKDIAPILNSRCVECHRTGEIGPFTLQCYEDVLGWEDTILEVVADNRMPPWHANPAHGEFKNDARLSEKEKETLRKWVSQGMPEGDPDDLPEAPKFVEGWRIPEPDQIFRMTEPFNVPAKDVVDYQRFRINPGWTEDKYIYAAEARPGNSSVVHHILVYIRTPGARRGGLRSVLVGYAPGSVPIHFEPGTAIFVPKGSELIFEMHYTPNGSPQTDQSYAGVCFADPDEVKNLVYGEVAINERFYIPAGEPAKVVTADYYARRNEKLISLTPHMHLRGKSFKYHAFFPDGSDQVLLDVPAYDFNWQLKYILKEPLDLPKGTRIRCTATFDNSENNLVNPDPTKTVTWGEQSWDEMMIGFIDTVSPKPK